MTRVVYVKEREQRIRRNVDFKSFSVLFGFFLKMRVTHEVLFFDENNPMRKE